MKLTPLQEKWLQALESGKYPQGVGRLCDCYGLFCCLGVACEIAGGPKTKLGERFYYEGEDVWLPQSVMHLFGFRGASGRLKKYWGDIASLAKANDEGKTFAEIAAYVREHPEDVFVETNE